MVINVQKKRKGEAREGAAFRRNKLLCKSPSICVTFSSDEGNLCKSVLSVGDYSCGRVRSAGERSAGERLAGERLAGEGLARFINAAIPRETEASLGIDW